METKVFATQLLLENCGKERMRSIYNIPAFSRAGITGLLWGEFGFDPVPEAAFLVLVVVAFLAAADSLGSWASGFFLLISCSSSTSSLQVLDPADSKLPPDAQEFIDLIFFLHQDAKLCFKTVVINCCCVLQRSSSSKECCAGGGGGLAPLLLV